MLQGSNSLVDGGKLGQKGLLLLGKRREKTTHRLRLIVCGYSIRHPHCMTLLPAPSRPAHVCESKREKSAYVCVCVCACVSVCVCVCVCVVCARGASLLRRVCAPSPVVRMRDEGSGIKSHEGTQGVKKAARDGHERQPTITQQDWPRSE